MRNFPRFDDSFIVDGTGGNLVFKGQWDTLSDTKTFMDHPVRVLSVSNRGYNPTGKVVYQKGLKQNRYILASFQSSAEEILLQAIPVNEELVIKKSKLVIDRITGAMVSSKEEEFFENIACCVKLADNPSNAGKALATRGTIITATALVAGQLIGSYSVVAVNKINHVFCASVTGNG